LDYLSTFKLITGFKALYPHQKKTMDYLLCGKSIILRAPTGSGKSEAVIIPFLIGMNQSLPSQIIYSLPVRTLVNDLAERFKRYVNIKWLDVAAHHGKRVETPLFYPPIIVTTIDQTIGAYVCTPLSLSVRHGNIPAGAVASALLIFDEVHTFDPKRALQSVLILARHSEKIGLPFVFMSATMPDTFIDKLGKIIQFEKIDAEEKDIPVRKNRNLLIYWEGKLLNAEIIKKKYEQSKGRVIVVCNTVDKAQGIYKELEGKVNCEVILLHSRFLDEDRAKKEKQLKEIFGLYSKKRGILISTQVIEVGMDISCDTMIAELSPIDSLLQRAGRCARWGGEGNLYVYSVEKAIPYKEELMEDTKKEVERVSGERLDWKLEKQLVNKVLGKYAEEWLNSENTAHILNTLSKAAFTGEKKLAEDAVREVFSCEIAIHNNPFSLDNPYKLKTVKIHTGVLRKFFNKKQPKMWKIEENNIISDEASDVRPIKIQSPEEIVPYSFYIVHPNYIKYTSESGLLFEPRGENFECESKREYVQPQYEYEKEGWVEHSRKTLKVFETIFLPRYRFAIEKFAKAWKMEYSDFVEKMKIAILLHDIGKLNKKWQEKAGWKEGEEPLAHSGNEDIKKFPSHAPISAYALKKLFIEWKIKKAIKGAIAHHHSVRAHKIPKYCFIEEWEKQVLQAIKDTGLNLNLKDINSWIRSSPPPLRILPDIMDPKLYRTYTLISRILRLSDQIATGGSENAIFCYKNWYGNV